MLHLDDTAKKTKDQKIVQAIQKMIHHRANNQKEDEMIHSTKSCIPDKLFITFHI